jgi:hypothetical protein
MPIHDWTKVDAGIFHHFHLGWVAALGRQLNSGLLSGDFYALVEQVAGPGNPDVLALRSTDGNGDSSPDVELSDGGGLAVAAPKVWLRDRADDEVYATRTRSVVVRRTNGDRVVAVVEIVSPGNKGSRYAIRAFVNKSVDYLNAGVHLLILDLFPPTPRDPQGIHPVIWSEVIDRPFVLPGDKRLTLAAYFAGLPKEAFVQPVAVGDRLPDMALFLTPELFVDVPLERTYEAAWAEVPRRWQQVLDPPAT